MEKYAWKAILNDGKKKSIFAVITKFGLKW